MKKSYQTERKENVGGRQGERAGSAPPLLYDYFDVSITTQVR